ncbi:MAG: aminotransferase class I/II-fold pyridoxal phosphate-dependent enzyme [Alphaproteobacteria bacterium]
MIKLADTIQNLPHSPTLWANDLVHTKREGGQTIYHMGFGESSFPVPERLQKALGDAAHKNNYLPADGLSALIRAIKAYYRPIFGDEYIDKSDVIIAPGSKLILYSIQMSIQGDLLMPVPSWVSYGPQARMLHTDVVKVCSRRDDEGYHIRAEDLEEAIAQGRKEGKNPTKLILNSPSNPTGLVIPDDELQAIAQVCKKEGVLIISDEIYGFVRHNDCHYKSIAPMAPDITAVTTGLSKHLSLGGWRVGFGFIPKGVEGLHNALRCISSETWSCAAAPIQHAVVEAFQGHEDLEKHMRDCADIHGYMNQTISKGLQSHGIIAPMVQGAFYNYPDFEPFREALAANGIKTSQDLHEVLLEEYNLATLPGKGFGAEDDVLTLRLSGCDYDGGAALAAYQAGEALDHAFVEKYAPHILKAIDLFGAFLEKYA